MLLKQRFLAAVSKHGDEPAVRSISGSLTFNDLAARAAGVAVRLEEAGVQEGDLIGLSVGRGIDAVVGAVGALIAGAVYVPLEIQEPIERLTHMAKETSLRVALVDAHAAPVVGALMESVVDIASCGESSMGSTPVLADPDPLLCVIYTSGSTGAPKGVEMTQRGVLGLTDSLAPLMSEHKVRSVPLFASMRFDGAIHEIFPTLLTGCSVWTLAEDPAFTLPDDMFNELVAVGVDMVILPPSYLMLADPEQCKVPAVIVVAGERCPPVLATRWSHRTALYNMYGPSEVTCIATVWRCSPNDGENVPIGLPLTDVEAAILDNGVPVEQGAAGELHLGGPLLARGYWAQPDLTEERFRTVTFPDKTRRRMYATGDLARQREDGTLIFIGRIDRQIKLRGFRIEPEDVEAGLHACDGVDEAVVMAVGDGELAETLVAFVKGSNARNPSRLKQHLVSCRPEYMVPSQFVEITEWPTTANGKIDHAALRARV
jgi:amino acid adenylation domain-containing protein